MRNDNYICAISVGFSLVKSVNCFQLWMIFSHFKTECTARIEWDSIWNCSEFGNNKYLFECKFGWRSLWFWNSAIRVLLLVTIYAWWSFYNICSCNKSTFYFKTKEPKWENRGNILNWNRVRNTQRRLIKHYGTYRLTENNFKRFPLTFIVIHYIIYNI